MANMHNKSSCKPTLPTQQSQIATNINKTGTIMPHYNGKVIALIPSLTPTTLHQQQTPTFSNASHPPHMMEQHLTDDLSPWTAKSALQPLANG